MKGQFCILSMQNFHELKREQQVHDISLFTCCFSGWLMRFLALPTWNSHAHGDPNCDVRRADTSFFSQMS